MYIISFFKFYLRDNFPRPHLSLFDPFTATSRPLTATNLPGPKKISTATFLEYGRRHGHLATLSCLQKSFLIHLKEQCHEIFRVRFFSSNTFSWSQLGMPRTNFEFFRIFVELFVFVVDSPAMNTPGSRLESFRFGRFCKHKSHVPREVK